MRRAPLRLGAVAYDPKVVTIWDGFRTWLTGAGLGFDYVLFSNYEALVDAHLAGQVDVSWDSPLAWVRLRRAATADGRACTGVVMRDTDRDLTSVVVSRAGANIDAPADLAGRAVATGSVDSPQARLLPVAHLASQLGVDVAAIDTIRFDAAPGTHGDNVGGERDALRAMLAGEADAACLLDASLLLFAREGWFDPRSVVTVCRTDPFDHCILAVLDGADSADSAKLGELLCAMSYDDSEARRLLDLEGLRQWLPARTSGFGALESAVDSLGFYGPGGEITADDYDY